jgi:hypothetical protein
MDAELERLAIARINRERRREGFGEPADQVEDCAIIGQSLVQEH